MVLIKALNIISKEEKQMAYKISDECIMCGTCEGECPVGACLLYTSDAADD